MTGGWNERVFLSNHICDKDRGGVCMSSPLKDRRAFARVGSSAVLTLRVDRDPGKEFSATSKNISTRSICFETDAPLEVNDRVNLKLFAISGHISVPAVVIRRDGLEVACQFADVGPEDANQIKNWLFPPFEP